MTVDASTAALIRRDQFRELGVSVVAAIVAVTVYAARIPATVRVIPWYEVPFESDGFAYETNLEAAFGLVVVLIGSMAVAGLAWALIVERRVPWPIGPRRGDPPIRRLWNVVATLSAWFGSWFLAALLPTVHGPFPIPGDGDSFFVFDSILGEGRQAVLFLAIWPWAYEIAMLVMPLPATAGQTMETNPRTVSVQQ